MKAHTHKAHKKNTKEKDNPTEKNEQNDSSISQKEKHILNEYIKNSHPNQ